MSKNNSTIVYKLEGRSLEAALRLEEELKAEIERTPPLQTGKLGDISDSWQVIYKNLHERLAEEAPEVLELTGLTRATVQVNQGPQTLPRAYEHYPQIYAAPFSAPNEPTEYFMYVPVDYQGDHFVPEDGVRQTEDEEHRLGALLFADGWLDNAPIAPRKRHGVETPADYEPPSESELRQTFSRAAKDRVCFIAAGRSLEIVEHYRARQADWKAKLKKVQDAIKAAVEKAKPEILAALPQGENVYINSSYSYSASEGDKAQIRFSIRREGRVGVLTGGKTVNAPSTFAFDVEADGGEYRVVPRTDTPEGRAFKKLLDDVPVTPTLRGYLELHPDFKVNGSKRSGAALQDIDVGGYTILLYTAPSKSDKTTFCPPGAKPFPIEALEWLRADENDRGRGVTSPPMPAALRALLDNNPAVPRSVRSGPHPQI